MPGAVKTKNFSTAEIVVNDTQLHMEFRKFNRSFVPPHILTFMERERVKLFDGPFDTDSQKIR